VCTGPEKADCRKCADGFKNVNGVCEDATKWFLLAKDFSTKTFTDANGWSAENVLAKSLVTSCGEIKLFGGYEVFGEGAIARKVFNMPKHTKVRIQVQLWKIDAWEV
jgi:hypothetical protein